MSNFFKKKNFFKILTLIFAVIFFILFVILISMILEFNKYEIIDNGGIDSNREKMNIENMQNNKFVIIQTNKGDIKVELFVQKSKITTKNFLNYVNLGFYDGTIFHRVIDDFMIQGGGYLPNMSLKNTKAPIKLESDNGLKNLKGTIAMARTSKPNSATSQFFINTKDNNFLDYKSASNPGYAVFGKVVEGIEVVKKIESVKTSKKSYFQDWPVEDIIIEKIYLVE